MTALALWQGGHFSAYARTAPQGAQPSTPNLHSPILNTQPQTPAPHSTTADTLRLQEIEVKATAGRRPRISSDASATFGKEALMEAPQMLGESDPLRFLRNLPGVTAAGDYSSGVMVDGMDYSQNLYRLNGIPIHFPYHFGGIFSAFSPNIYTQTHLTKTIKPAAESSTLGAIVALTSPSDHLRKLSAGLSAGMIASSAWINAPLSSRFSVAASGRISYIDALYSELLRSNDSQAAYNLADADLCALYTPTSADKLRATFHYNGDIVDYTDLNLNLTTSLKWHNLAAAVEWMHHSDVAELTNQVYFTQFRNLLRLNMVSIRLDAPTQISETGLHGSVNLTGLRDNIEINATYAGRLYSIEPQWIELAGMGQENTNPRRAATLSGEASLTADATLRLPHNHSLRAGAALNFYRGNDAYTAVHPDLRLSATRSWRRGSITLHLGEYHQYLHQVGFSDLGMSSNFKIAASRMVKPQRSLAAALAGSLHAAEGLTLNADVYYKRLRWQPEYLGGVLDIINPGYLAENYIVMCRGYNAGVNLSGRYESTRLTAMASYSYTYSRRHMPGEPLPFAATNELRHSLTATGAYHFGAHWSVSASFNLASGRPYTPVKAIYFIGQQIMMEYGARNSARLPRYHRLDLGATYSFETGGSFPLRHSLNLSVINAYGHRNVELTKFDISPETGIYHRRELSSLYRFLPSLSYSISF